MLLGVSSCGMLAYLYANTYPDDVVGMVLLYGMFPDELTLESLVPPEERFVAYDQEDETESLERISHYKVLKAAEPDIGKERQHPGHLPRLHP